MANRYKRYENLEITFNTSSLLALYLKAPSDDFCRALLNIITNSVESLDTNKKNSIELKTIYINECLRIKITDTGEGISRENINKVTKKNFTFGKKKGTGKGLSQVLNFINSCNGTFNISSELSAGTSVELEVPVLELNINEIIHIDDEELLRRAWVKYFSERGITVHSYNSPTDFLERRPENLNNIPTFIDSYMGDEERGELFAQKMYQEGYEEIYLASADSRHLNISDFPWIREAMGKSAKEALNILIKNL